MIHELTCPLLGAPPTCPAHYHSKALNSGDSEIPDNGGFTVKGGGDSWEWWKGVGVWLCMSYVSCLCSTAVVNKEMVGKLEGRLGVAKEELTAASLKLSILVKTFRQSQLHLASSRAAASNVPGQSSKLSFRTLLSQPFHCFSVSYFLFSNLVPFLPSPFQFNQTPPGELRSGWMMPTGL